jgi:hypothetical protein
MRELDFSHIPPVWLKSLARYAAAGWAPTIARMPEDRRIATLVLRFINDVRVMLPLGGR